MINIQNIYCMLAYAFRSLKPDGYQDLSNEAFDNVHSLLATIFSQGLAAQIKRGLHREYIRHNESSFAPRGKIILSETMRSYPVNKLVSYEVDDFSEESYFNRILKTTAELMRKCDDIKIETKKSLKKSLLFLSSVDALPVNQIQWRRLTFNRNNQSYKMLLNLCYLYIEGLILTEQNGKIKFMKFIDDQKVSKLYERFILEYYKRHFPCLHPSASEIEWVSDDSIIEFLPHMKSDVTLHYKDKTLIIDAKYYGQSMQSNFDVKTVHSNNLYQIFTYVKNKDATQSGNVSGMLLYAKTDEDITPDFDYKLSGNSIGVHTLDLNVPFETISAYLDQIVISWVPELERRKVNYG